jgi:hypothetical protein
MRQFMSFSVLSAIGDEKVLISNTNILFDAAI